MAHVASKGQWLVVLSPQSVADDVIAIHREALEKYESLQSSSFSVPLVFLVAPSYSIGLSFG